jgi:hypothetical protein
MSVLWEHKTTQAGNNILQLISTTLFIDQIKRLIIYLCISMDISYLKFFLSQVEIIRFCTRFPYLFCYKICIDLCWYATHLLQHDFNAAKAIYVSDDIDFFNAAHEYSSRKF